MVETRLTYLLTSYFAGTATGDETNELMALIDLPVNEEAVKEVLDQEWERRSEEGTPVFTANQSSRMVDAILRPAGQQYSGYGLSPARQSTVWMRRRAAIAAAVVLLLLGGYWWRSRPLNRLPADNRQQSVVVQDVEPGTQGAVLTLGNGSRIVMDSMTTAVVTSQGNALTVMSPQGKILVPKGGTTGHPQDAKGSANANGAPDINTLTTARGKQFQVQLSDGTKVWLNAASSIRFPSRFADSTRKVTITGEAYFEVSKDARHPFIVEAGRQQIRVLGTSFNVNVYADEQAETTTLLEGAVQVENRQLKPGQAAVTATKGSTHIVTADVDQAIAWKNGAFSFNSADLPTVMRQLSRWYNVDVEYKGAIPAGDFSGEIGRNLTLSQVLRLLTKTRIRYEIQPGHKILILPND